MRSLKVVAFDELPAGSLEMALDPNEQPVEALGPSCPDKALGEGVGSGRPDQPG